MVKYPDMGAVSEEGKGRHEEKSDSGANSTTGGHHSCPDGQQRHHHSCPDDSLGGAEHDPDRQGKEDRDDGDKVMLS
jgi:hypothetical protein